MESLKERNRQGILSENYKYLYQTLINLIVVLSLLKSHNYTNYPYSVNSSETEVMFRPHMYNTVNAEVEHKLLKKMISHPRRASGYRFPYKIEEMTTVLALSNLKIFTVDESPPDGFYSTWSLCPLNFITFLSFSSSSVTLYV